MTDKIEPALTAEEWASGIEYEYSVNRGDRYMHDGPDSAHKIIALANAELPEGDPRKITREMVNSLRDFCETIPALLSETREPFTKIADALESYLPPEGM